MRIDSLGDFLPMFNVPFHGQYVLVFGATLETAGESVVLTEDSCMCWASASYRQGAALTHASSQQWLGHARKCISARRPPAPSVYTATPPMARLNILHRPRQLDLRIRSTILATSDVIRRQTYRGNQHNVLPYGTLTSDLERKHGKAR